MDYSKAFDTVPHNLLLRKLEMYGVRGTALNLLRSFLLNRTHSTKIENSLSSPLNLNIGLPQGSNLSPFLFILFVNDLCNISNTYEKILFADDTTFYFTSSNYGSLIESCNKELDLFYRWSVANRLSINTDKTCYMIFGNRTIPEENRRINLNSAEIRQEFSICYLGVLIDDKLKFNAHIDSICTKISRSLGIIYNIRNNTPRNCLLMLYHSLIYPYLHYCCLAWGKAFQSHVRRLEILQKRVLRILNFKSYYEHTTPLFISNKILRVGDIYNLRLMCYLFNNPRFIEEHRTTHEHETRNRHNLQPQFQRLAVCQQAISFQGPRIWNEVPLQIKQSASLVCFKARYKTYLLSQYSNVPSLD